MTRDCIKVLLICCLCVFFSSTAAHAQYQYDPTDPAAGSKVLELPDMSNVDMAAGIAAQKKAQEAIEKAAVDSMQREVDEAVYYQRGLTMDFLNKPIELFKLTCTAKSKVDRETGKKEVQLTPSFRFNKQMWKDFCKDSKSNAKSAAGRAVKCAFDNLLQSAFNQAVDQLEKFKDQNFCKAFTSFVNDQLSQCINIRVNMPRGQFPGFPAFNQCLFGRLNLSVGADGVHASGNTGPALAEVVSVHSFNYDKNIQDFSPFGFGGKEQQLLGENGLSSLMDNANWSRLTVPGVAGATCGQLDPELVKILDEYPSRDMGAGMNVLLFTNPHIKATKLAEGEGKGTRIVADYKQVFNPGLGSEESILIPPTPEAGGGPDPLSWSVKPGYTYLASCYGFEREDPAMACQQLKIYSPDAYAANCLVEKDPEGCCNPDTTDCIGAGLLYQEDACVDGQTTKDDKGNTICVQLAHKAGDAMICEGACCNPSVNDCGLINSKICEKYIPVKQCLTATPAQQAMFDPIYSKLRAKPNMMIDGRMCCATEWCNFCPQDIILAGMGKPMPSTVFVKASDLANVPDYCKARPRTNGNNNMNDNLGNQVLPLADQVFENTQEACTLMREQEWDRAKIFKIFIVCPQKEASVSKIPFIGGAIASFAGAVEGCPSGGQVKPYSLEVINTQGGCDYLADITAYPMPITKIPKVEEGDPIGLCSELDLCPAAIPAGENPYGTLKSVACKMLEKVGKKCLIDTMLGGGTTTTPTGPEDSAICRDATGAQVRCAGVEGETIVPNTGNDGTKTPVEPIVIPDVPTPVPSNPSTQPVPDTNEPAGKLY